MSKVQTLRVFVNQRLTAAAEEIFDLFERTIAEYEEEVQQQWKLLNAVFKPEVRLHRAVFTDDEQLLVIKEEVPPEQRDWSPSLDQEDPPEPPHIKEEQEELWTNQEGEQLHELEATDIMNFTFSPVPVKREEREDKPQSSQLHLKLTEENGEVYRLKTEADEVDCGGPEPARNLKPDSHLQPATHDQTSYSCEPETDDSWDCDEEISEPQSGLNPLQNNEVPVSKTPFSSSEGASGFGKKRRRKRNRILIGMRPFSCSLCHKKFIRHGTLAQHMTVHTGEKPFCCSLCDGRFTRKGQLTHLVVHTGERPFSCSFCGKNFTTRWALTNHMTVHTGEKPFRCKVCDVRFRQKAHLKKHMLVHTGERPFSCSICGRRFAQHSTLKGHMIVHLWEKPYSCSDCGKRFTRLRTLRRHSNLHSRNNL